MNVVLIGHPNAGKSTLIQALTGSREKVGNWPGVTVEKKTGRMMHEGQILSITDLPGIDAYKLLPPDASTPLDQKITYDFLRHEKIDLIVHVIDASNIERHLYLTSQLLEIEIPLLIALNKIDLAHQDGRFIDEKKLALALGCPVIPLEAHKKKGVKALKSEIFQNANDARKSRKVVGFPPIIEHALTQLASELTYTGCDSLKRVTALALLENARPIDHLSNPSAPKKDLEKKIERLKKMRASLQQTIEQQLGTEADVAIASTRYEFANQVASTVISVEKTSHKIRLSDLLDHIFLNRWLGIPLFLVIMYGLFFFSIHVGQVFQDFFEILGESLFVDGTAYGLNRLGMPTWLIAVVSQGVGKGMTTTLSFIPVLSALFFALSFLEMSGYMARTAFMMDRLMKMIGLSGKSFIPLIIGFGCNVPAIMATRTLSNEKDRILTIMMTPFMSCSARFAIYAIFVTAFFPTHGENVIFLLYFIGILLAIFTAWLLKKRLKHETHEHTTIEMPRYHCPSLRIWTQLTFQRLKGFVLRTGAIIVPVSTLIYLLNAFALDGSINFQLGQPHSLLAQLGKLLTPLLQPMGIQENNWPATVGLLSGVLAKEVVIGTLNTLYAQGTWIQDLPAFDFWESLRQACASIPENLSGLKTLFHTAWLSPQTVTHVPLHKALQTHFHDKASAFAYLLFILLYIPCMSTFAVIVKELDWKWACISTAWSISLAYSVSVLFYQVATLPSHVLTSCLWIVCAVFLLASTIFSVHHFIQQPRTVSS